MYCVEDMYFIRQIEDTTHSQYIILMRIPSGSSGSGSSNSSDGLCVFSSPTSFLRSFPCFSNGTIPQFIDLEEFNASMHSRYGFKGSYKPITQTDFNILEDFHNYLDDSCKWMVKRWIDVLEPLLIGKYRQMYTTQINRQRDSNIERRRWRRRQVRVDTQIEIFRCIERYLDRGSRHRQMYTTQNNRQIERK